MINKLNINDVSTYIENNIVNFHDDRIKSLDNLDLKKILLRKNIYLFRAKNSVTTEEIIRAMTDAHLSSNEETLFGNWLECLAIYINGLVYDGYKSAVTGIDLEFTKDNIRQLVSIKSGANWGNSGQIKKMKDNFKSASKILRTSGSNVQVQAVNGCCYGRDKNPDKGDYFKYCGQDFWHYISNEKNLYSDIIEPLSHEAKNKNDTFMESYSNKINLFTLEFSKSFCKDNGEIDWMKLIKYNSSSYTN